MQKTQDTYKIAGENIFKPFSGHYKSLFECHDFVWDDWLIIHETVASINNSITNICEIQYFWGQDISATLQGAGGVGGLLAVSRNGQFYFPTYDNNGNIMQYVTEFGAKTTSYIYDDFGSLISQAGSMTNQFAFGFSTKYFDHETDLIAYQLRNYHPSRKHWLNRDPIEEQGGENLYTFCLNDAVTSYDFLGQDRYMTTFSVNPGKDQWHVGVAVDTWQCHEGQWIKSGIISFDYVVDDSSLLNRVGIFVAVAKGMITENLGMTLVNPHTIPSTMQQDIEMLKQIRRDKNKPPIYNFFFNNCLHWATEAIDYGL